jgi:plasmid stabilization system protein ParE
MTYQVFILSDAEDDLYKIYRYVAAYDSIDKAESLFNKLEGNMLHFV